jgi:hypothetical protein
VEDTWDTVFEPFARDAAAAFILAQILTQLKDTIRADPDQAVVTLDQAVKELYPYTRIYQAQYRVYLLAVAGQVAPKDDPTADTPS